MIVKTSIPCCCIDSCGCVTLIDFEEFNDDPRQVWVEFSLGYHGGFRGRLRTAWRVLRGRDPWLHAICFEEPGIEQMRAALAGREGRKVSRLSDGWVNAVITLYVPPVLYRQYRAAARDKGDERPDHGIVTQRRELAEKELEDMLTMSEPSYDEGWIETRLVSDWGRA